jgi:hypothetical protein
MAENIIKTEKVLKETLNNDLRKLVISRLSVLSPTTKISLGSAGSFTRDELIKSIEQGENVGEKIIEIEIEWLRSFKEKIIA